MNIETYVLNHKAWSEKTFGLGPRTEGNLKHIEKEIAEVRKDPTDLMEWIDIAILALDGAWRAGYTAKEIEMALVLKQSINFNRQWPAPGPADQPVEHAKNGVDMWEKHP